MTGELARRRALDYPPFADLIRVVCSAGPPGRRARRRGRSPTRPRAPHGATVLGPAPLFRLRGRHRSQVVVKAHDRAAAIAAVRVAVDRAANRKEHRDVAFSVDVDPM